MLRISFLFQNNDIHASKNATKKIHIHAYFSPIISIRTYAEEDPELALQILLSALEIQNDDLDMHIMAMELAQKLSLWSST